MTPPSTPAIPVRMGWERLLGRAVWDEDGVRDDVRDYLVEHLGDPGAVLVVDETGVRHEAPWYRVGCETHHRPPQRSDEAEDSRSPEVREEAGAVLTT